MAYGGGYAGGAGPAYGGGGLNSGLGTAPPSGGNGWFGSLTDPLGIVSAAKGLVGGIAKGFGGIGMNLMQGAIGTGYNLAADVTGNSAQADWGGVAHSFEQAGQGVGDFGAAMLTSGESLASTAALPFGGRQGLTGVLERDVFQPFNKWLGKESLAGGPGAFNAMSTEMGQQLYNGGKGMQPADFIANAEHGGVGGAVIQTAAQAAMTFGPIEGATAGLAGNAAEAAGIAESAGALADAAKYTDKAVAWQRINEAVTQAAHPVRTGITALSDLSQAARDKAFPANIPEGTTYEEPPPPDPNLQPAMAAAHVIGSSEQTYGPSADLMAALHEATAAAVTEKFQETPPPEGTVRLYNGGSGDRTMWTTDKARAEAHAGDAGLRHVDVPAAEADVMKTTAGTEAHQAAMAVGHQPNTAVDYYMTPGELAQHEPNIVEHEATTTFRPAEGVQPQVEPARYKVDKGQVMSPEEKAIADGQLREVTQAARDNVTPDLYVFDELGRRMATPTPAWATWISEQLPDSINRLIGSVGHNLVTAARYRDLYRNAMQVMETAQRAARTSPAMTQAIDAARALLSSTVGRDIAEARVGEELHARLNGEALLGEFAKNHGGNAPTQLGADALRAAGRGGYVGVTDEMLQQLSPTDRVAFEQHMQAAQQAFRTEASNAMQVLLSTRFGAKGLEQAVLGPDEVPMSAEQMRLYRRSMRDLAFADKARERIPTEQAKAVADAAKAEAVGANRWGFVDTLRARLGLTLQTAEDLYRGLPKGLQNDGAQLVQDTLRTVATDGGAYMDVAQGIALHPTSGIYVPLAQQFDIPAADWATQGPQVLHDALLNPKDNNGGFYDPQRLYGGLDARLAVRVVDDGQGGQRIVGTLAQSTINGEAIRPWQAAILGPAHEATAGFDFGNGKDMAFTIDPNEQTLMKHYVGMALDSKSNLARWANERSAVGAQLSITPEQLNNEMSSMLWLDRIMADKSNQWKTGDIFNTTLAAGKGEPGLDYLAQTIMADLTTHDHVDQAMTTADAMSVNRALRWYYDSHDFVENMYRGKTIPLTGRDAAETFYDVLALTSVMASPTQNLGRALAGFANLDDFLQSRKDALTNTQKVIDEVMGNKPAQVVYVKNLGVSADDVPRTLGETDAAYKRRLAQSTERLVKRGEGGTAVSQRWLDSPAARELSAQTSMTTQPKYRIIDALLGKFNLETATAADIGGQPEWWTGQEPKTFSDVKVSPQAVLHHAELLGVTGPELDAYRQWAVTHERIGGAAEVRQAAGRNYVTPITDSEDFQRQRAQSEGDIMGGRKVSAHEYQSLAYDGRSYVERALADSSPHVLADPALRRTAFDNVQEEWGGATVDAHTGVPIPGDYKGDTFAVTARLPGMKEIAIPIGSSEAAFNAAYARALKMYEPVLNSDGGHLGVFRNEDTGKIEIDPVYHTLNVHDTEAVGTYTHANGGAYHFMTGNGYWTPHVADDEHFASMQKAKQAMAQSVVEGRGLAQTGNMRNAYENALMEYHGSGLLAKLRSFRDNLAHPETSLAVTLDSIMGQLFGFDQTHWGIKGEYAKYADQIREVADQWSQIAGRKVMPHEVQALLWIYAKRFIGEQDWGRLQAHTSAVHTLLNDLERRTNEGAKFNVKNLDPLGAWWKEELQFSRDQLAVRTERRALRTGRTAGTLTPEESARLDYLNSVPTRHESSVVVQTKDGTVEYQTRHEGVYDANTLRMKEDQQLEYMKTVATPFRKAIEAGDFAKAHQLIDEYVGARRKAILGVVEGEAFGPRMVEDPKGVGAQSIARLQYAKHVPAPNNEAFSTSELMDKFGDRVRGVTLEHPNKLGRIMMRLYSTADFTTLLHEDLHAFRLHAPGDEVAQFSTEYPHIQDATLTPARVADEERFVSDFMGYIRQRSAGGTYAGPLAPLFNSVADTIEQHYGTALKTENGKAVPNQIVNYWDSIFNADIANPAANVDPLQAQMAAENRGVNPVPVRGESPAAFTQRVRQYGEARGRANILQQRIRDAEARARQADKFANTMQGIALEPTRSEMISARLEDRANNTLSKLADQLGNAEGRQVPRVWRPFMDAVERIRQEAKDDPSLAPLLDEIPQNFAAALRYAAERGFEPQYIPELTFDQAQKYLFKHLTLGSNATEALTRKENLSVLSSRGVTDRSLDALGSGTVIAMKEQLQSRIIQFTEEHYARQWAPGTPIPEGWSAWAPTRDAIITGRNIDNKTVAVNADMIVPDVVVKTLRNFQRPPVDLPFRFIWKGPPMQVWKHLLLTFSPTWYIKHFIGAVSLASLEGVRWNDWKTAWSQFKTDGMPDMVKGRAIYQTLDDVMGTKGTLMSRNKITDLPDLIRSEGYHVAAQEIMRKMDNVVTTVDSISRAAVYAKTLREGGSVAFAATRAFEALGDFGRLGPIERSMVSQLIPFYAFQKAMFRILIHMPVDHPFATGILMQLGTMHEAYMKDRLGGALPDAFLGASFLPNGHLIQLDKLNPLTDTYRMMTLDGLVGSANPFIRLLAQEALHSPTYNSQAGMDANGNLVYQPDLGQAILDTYLSPTPGLGKPLGADMLAVTSQLSDKQYQSLIKRITKTLKAKQTVAAGGYLVTDVNKPRSVAATPYGGR